MVAMDTPGAVDLVRSSSQTSTASSSRKSSTVRLRPSKRLSNTSTSRSRASSPAADTKSLTSFPSLSPTPDTSPVQSRVNGWFRAAIGDHGDKIGLNGENKPLSSPDTVRAVISADPGPTSAPTMRKVTKSTQQIVGSLVAATPSARERTALFDDTPQELDRVPGGLHYSSDDNIEHLLERVGPVTLVRQLAGDLAQRDDQITALRRRAEERERILRKMLQECEVSNMDIEKRLRELDRDVNGKRQTKMQTEISLSGTHPEDDIDSRLARALEDDISERSEATHFHSGDLGPDMETASINSTTEAPRQTTRGNWKSYLWTGTSRKTSRAASVSSKLDQDVVGQTHSRASSKTRKSRKPISNDLFVPPASGPDKGAGAVPTLRRLQSQDQEHSNGSSRRSSTSIANWALKMVAGTGQTKSSDRQGTLRGRDSLSFGQTDRDASIDSMMTSRSAKGANGNGRGRGLRTSMGPNGTIKSLNSGNGTANAVVPSMPDRLGSLGPVEMDRILPEESRPPTLVQQHNRFSQTSEYLTDRFGFIYDQRRKKRQSEAAAAMARQNRNSNIESLGDTRTALAALGFNEDTEDPKSPGQDVDEISRPPSRPGSNSSAEQGPEKFGKTWQDYLKLATHPTELLSHTPSAAPITAVEVPDAGLAAPKISQVTVAKRGSLPTTSYNPEPSPSRVVSGNAEFATVSPSPMDPSSPINPLFANAADPVKALLEQLTELHDFSQREKTVKWNEFLRKVRAERKREGDAASATEGRPKNLTMPEALLGDGEIVGVASLGNKGKVGRAKWQEFRRLVLGGIPVAYRAQIWTECSGASTLRIPGYYDDLVNNGDDNPTIISQIQMDITRTLTDNIFFRKGPGVSKLNEVLVAYSRRNKEVGYCQGMNLITACLLLIMPTAEDAFWVLATMIENILPGKYYDQHLLTSRADQSVLREYVAELLPKLSAHLDALEIELEALTFQWFLSVFTDCLSAEALFRVWDVVLCMHDGSTFLFQVALALLKLNEKALRECDTPAGVYHYINHQMTNHAISIDGLIQASDALGKVVKRKDVEERRERAVQREQELMRRREELRQERRQKRKADDADSVMGVGKAPSISASLDVELSMHTSPMRTPLSSASRRSEEEEDADILNQSLEDLMNKTPLPIEEESFWRG